MPFWDVSKIGGLGMGLVSDMMYFEGCSKYGTSPPHFIWPHH